MALAQGFTEYTPGAGGRVVVFTDKDPKAKLARDLLVEVYVSSDFDLGGGTLSIEASVQLSPNVATDADWHVLQGLEDVEANSCFRIAMRAPFLALNFNNVSNPTGKVFISDGYIS